MHFIEIGVACARRMLVRPVIAVRLSAPRAMESQIAGADETGFVRPAFGDAPGFQGFFQPRLRIVTQSREQHQVGAARYDVDAVDLQQAHAPDRCDQVFTPRTPSWCLQQALRCQLQGTSL